MATIMWLLFSSLLFLLGLYALATKRNLIKNAVGICILFAGANLNFIYFSLRNDSVNLLGHFIAITAIVLESCILAITLAYIYSIYKTKRTLNIRDLKKLKK